MAKEKNLELTVGGIVILAFVCLTVFILSVGDVAILEQGSPMKFIFNFGSGVKKAAPVRIAGVEAGIVKDVSLFFDEEAQQIKVAIDVLVDPKVKIPTDSTVMINYLGLLGEKYIEIIPGSNQKEFFKPNDVIVGRDPIIQEQISQSIMRVSKKVENGIDGLNTVITDPGAQDGLKTALVRLGTVSSRVDDILAQVQSGEGTVGRLFYDNKLYDDLQELTADLKVNPWKILYRPKTPKVKNK